ncbi:exodeoxyribonuclease VII large subunit [Ignavibacteriales bacterium]
MQLPQYKSVSKLSLEIKATLEMSFRYETIIGEISNFKPHSSGHWYFTLKDSGAAISCSMWSSNNKKLGFIPKDGMQVICSGPISVYPPRGSYQIDVQTMKNVGVGDLQVAFEFLKEKLSKEGLFDPSRKKTIRTFPAKIGVVTSSTGAAWQDIIAVAARRFPMIELILAPARVQGEGAAKSIASAIDELNKFDDIEVIIVGRGGGSLEDLWAFNEEVTARAITRSRIPIISAVGHEVDFTIADFVADLRAATPTAAMELVTPDFNDVTSAIENLAQQIENRTFTNLNAKQETVNRFVESPVMSTPLNIVKLNSQRLDYALMQIDHSLTNLVKDYKNRVNSAILHLKANDHKRILKKGFVFVTQKGKFIKMSTELDKEKSFDLNFFDGKILIEGNDE